MSPSLCHILPEDSLNNRLYFTHKCCPWVCVFVFCFVFVCYTGGDGSWWSVKAVLPTPWCGENKGTARDLELPCQPVQRCWKDFSPSPSPLPALPPVTHPFGILCSIRLYFSNQSPIHNISFYEKIDSKVMTFKHTMQFSGTN